MPTSLNARRRAIDVRAQRRLVGHGPSPADVPLALLSQAADNGKLWFALAGGLALTGPAGRRAAARGVIALSLASAAANLVGKRVVGGARPDLASVPTIRRTRRTPTSGSFPSGHTASAVAFSLAAVTEKPLLAALLGPLAVGVGYSRIHTGAHWLSDVVGGALVGVAAAAVVTAVSPPDWLRRRLDGPPGEVRSLPALGDGSGLMVIANPHSGQSVQGRVDPLVTLRAALPRATIRTLAPGDDLVQLFELAAADFVALGACGGDGTVAAAATVAIAHGKPLLVLPGGTYNHFARALGADDVGATVRAAREGTGVTVDVATARAGDLGPWTVLNTASIGVYPEMVALRERVEGRIGKPLAAVWATHRALRAAAPIHAARRGRPGEPVWTVFYGVNRYRPRVAAPIDRGRLDDGVVDVRVLRPRAGRAHWRNVGAELLGSLWGGRLRRRHDDGSTKATFLMETTEDAWATFSSGGAEVLFAHDGELERIPAAEAGVAVDVAIAPTRLLVYRG